jgi:hypothetical protein
MLYSARSPRGEPGASASAVTLFSYGIVIRRASVIYRHPRQSVIGCSLALAVLAGVSGACTAAGDEPGVWQSHELTFNYLGATPTYSCNGLQHVLTGLLKKAGAGPDISVLPGPCARGFTVPEQLLHARLRFSTLSPAASTDSVASGNRRNGSWHHVTIEAHDPVLQGGNCELVQEFKQKVLPLFATRNVQANLPCIPYQDIGYFFSLSFDVFAPSKPS